MPMPVRTRYSLLIIAGAFALVYFLSPIHRDALTLSAASAVRWTRQKGHGFSLPPILGGGGEGDATAEGPPPLPPIPVRRKKKKGGEAVGGRGGKGKTKSGKGKGIKDGQQSDTEADVTIAPVGYGDALEREFASWKDEQQRRPKPPYKPARGEAAQVLDPFPLLTHPPRGSSLARLLAPPAVNAPTQIHYPEETPLMIGFTRNWPQLLQCVASYVAAGWPPGDIYIVENTGVMFANRDGRLGLQNPFYLNHTQLTMLGVNVIVTPTLLSFAQLQNFYAWTALEHNWTEYFWSHQDLLVFSFENETIPADPSDPASPRGHYSLYSRAVAILRYLRQPGIPKWANHFFAYDHLTLVHRDAHLDVGGWDTHIPFYATDCDMYNRLAWAGYWQGETPGAGIILDVSTVLDDVGALFRIPGIEARFAADPGLFADEPDEQVRRAREAALAYAEGERRRREAVARGGEAWDHLVEVGRRMEGSKYADGGGWRNAWQLRQAGGQGEPFYRDPEGFEIGLRMLIETGRRIFAEKWGHRGCDIAQMGILADDAWRLEKDWDPETEGSGSEGEDW